MQNEFTIKLPVSGQEVVLRRSTLLDEVINDREYAKEGADKMLQPWALIGRTVVTFDGKPGPMKAEDILGLASQDGDYLMRFFTRLNTLTPRMHEEINRFFEVPKTDSSPS